MYFGTKIRPMDKIRPYDKNIEPWNKIFQPWNKITGPWDNN